MLETPKAQSTNPLSRLLPSVPFRTAGGSSHRTQLAEGSYKLKLPYGPLPAPVSVSSPRILPYGPSAGRLRSGRSRRTGRYGVEYIDRLLLVSTKTYCHNGQSLLREGYNTIPHFLLLTYKFIIIIITMYFGIQNYIAEKRN